MSSPRIETALAASGLDQTCQTAVLAMSEAHDAKQWDRCVAVGDAWLEARGEMPALCIIWYAQALMGVKRYGEALQWSKTALDALPEHETLGRAAALGGYAQALGSVGEFKKARAALKQFLEVPTSDPEAIEKQGHILLTLSDKWAKGWAMHEARFQNGSKVLPPNCVPWDGKAKVPVAVLHEQGIGDAIMTARWLPWIEQQTGIRPTWYGPKLMERWFAEVADVGNIDNAAANEQRLTAVYVLSLPHVSGVRWPSDVPAPFVPESIAALRRNRVRGDTVKVGVCWKGADWGWHNFERSFTPEEFAPIVAELPNVEFVNLCHGAEVPAGWPFGGVAFSDIYATAEQMARLDLVVTVDTAVSHLAGSIGIPTITILPTKPDWRYEWPGGYDQPGGTPWYSSITTIRRKGSSDLSCITKARFMVDAYAKRVRRMAA